jgi:hypothetical protein
MEPVPLSVKELSDISEIIVARMEEIIQFFLDLLQVTGGDLAPEKCAWFLIARRWKDDKATLINPKASRQGI